MVTFLTAKHADGTTIYAINPKLPASGYRQTPSGLVTGRGVDGRYESASSKGANGNWQLLLQPTQVSIGVVDTTRSVSARCVPADKPAAVPAFGGRWWSNTGTTPLAGNGDVGGGYVGGAANLDFLRKLPATLGLGRYLVTDDRKKRKLNALNSYYYADGTPARLDGSEGQCMWCWNEHYFTTWVANGNTYEVVSLEPLTQANITASGITGAITEWASHHIPGGGTSWFSGGVYDNVNDVLASVISNDPRYRGGSGTDRGSYSGGAPAGSAQATGLGMVRSAAGTLSNGDLAQYWSLSDAGLRRGDGWSGGWYVNRAVVEYLFRIIMGTRYSQSAYNPSLNTNGLRQGGLGAGVTTVASAAWGTYNDYYPIVPTGFGADSGDITGTLPFVIPGASIGGVTSFNVPVFYGLVHPYGHIWQLQSGVIIKTGGASTNNMSANYIARSMSDWRASGGASGQAKWTNVTGMLNAGQSIASGGTLSGSDYGYGWIKSQSNRNLTPVVTALGGGASDALYWTDLYWYEQALNSYRVRLAGGDAYYGTYAGAFCTLALHASTYMTSIASAALCFFEGDGPVITVQ